VNVDQNNNQRALSLFFGMGTYSLFTASRDPDSSTWPSPVLVTGSGSLFAAAQGSDNLGNTFTFLGTTPNGLSPFDEILYTLPAGSTEWASPLLLNVDNSPNPVVNGNIDNGKGVFVWKTDPLAIQTARYAFATNQATPIGNISIPTQSPPVLDIVVFKIVVKNDNATTVFATSDGSVFQLYASTLLANQTTWSSPVLISTNATGVALTADPDGNATVLWTQHIDANHVLMQSAYIPLGGTPSPTETIADIQSPNIAVDSMMGIAVDSFGNTVAIWSQQTLGVPGLVQVASKPAGGIWGTPETLSSSGATPFVALSDQGTAVATWVDGITGVLMSSRNQALFPLHGATNFTSRIKANKFLTQTDYVLFLNWNPSPVPNVDYEIRKNGAVIATIPGQGPYEYVAHRQHKHLDATYTLTTVASNGNVTTTELQ
jgi:hypothetical protein